MDSFTFILTFTVSRNLEVSEMIQSPVFMAFPALSKASEPDQINTAEAKIISPCFHGKDQNPSVGSLFVFKC